MRVQLIVDGPTAPSRRVVVECSPGATARDLARALGGARCRASGRVLPQSALVGSPPLLHGARVTVDAPYAADRESSAWEWWVVGGPSAGLRHRIPTGTSTVGRGRGCDVVLDDPAVSRRHVEVRVDEDGVGVRDLGGTNGARVDGRPVSATATPCAPGAELSVGDSRLVLHRSPAGVRVDRPDGHGHLLVEGTGSPAETASPVEITFPEVPVDPRSPLPVLALVLPVVLSGVLAVVMHSPAMLLFGLTGPALSLGTWFGARRTGEKRRTARAYATAVADAQDRLARARAAGFQWLEDAHPDPVAVLATAERRSDRLFAGPDSEVRLGRGRVRSGVTVTGPGPPDDGDAWFPGAPVVLDLATAPSLAVVGDRGLALSAGRALVARWAVYASPEDLEVWVVASRPTAARDWGFAADLPHATRLRRAEGDEPASTLAALRAEVERRETEHEGQETRPGRGPRPTHTGWTGSALLVVDDGGALRTQPGADEVFRRGAALGVAHLQLGDTDPGAGAVLTVTEHRAELVVRSGGAPTRTLIDLDRPPWKWADRVGAALAPLRDTRTRDGPQSLPDSVRLLDLVGPVDAATVITRWRDGSRDLVLGTGVAGPLAVDLRTDGPHLLVAGTTGSGKSELLQTLVTSLALGHPPDRLQILLVDYKGGAAFRTSARMPHVVGLVTDLDHRLTARALVSLSAELCRRERAFARVGAVDLDAYDQARSADPSLPEVARLVIVIDEFRVLAEELPDFVHGLVRLAATGRSLGVHLVLATQRPGGVVSADIRANVSLRIGLRVRDRTDSLDVLDAPDAAAIGAATPGRAVLRGATTDLTLFQTAQVTGRWPDRVAVVVSDHDPWSPATEPANLDVDAPTDLDRVVAATREAQGRLGIPDPASPWLPPLPDRVVLGLAPPGSVEVPVGLVDRPEQQQQEVWSWSPDAGGLGIAGATGSGRTTALLTAALGLAASVGPQDLHLYAFGQLPELTHLPHLAGLADLDDPDLPRILLARLRSLATRPVPGRVVVLVDGWEALSALDHGAVAAELRSVLERGAASGMRLLATGGRGVLGGQLGSLLGRRLLLRVADPVDLAMAGVPTKAVPVHAPPGRGVDVATHLEVQVGVVPDVEAVVAQIAERWGLPPRDGSGGRARRLRALPDRIDLADLDPSPPDHTPAFLGVAVREGDWATCGVDPGRGERRVLIVGPPGSGRTSALVALSERLRTATPHRSVVVVGAPPASPGAPGLACAAAPGSAGVAAPGALGSARAGAPGPAVAVVPGPAGAEALGPAGAEALGPAGAEALGPAGAEALGPAGAEALGPAGAEALGPAGAEALGPAGGAAPGASEPARAAAPAAAGLDPRDPAAPAWLDPREPGDVTAPDAAGPTSTNGQDPRNPTPVEKPDPHGVGTTERRDPRDPAAPAWLDSRSPAAVDDLVALRRAHRDLAVLVDDAEQLAGSPLEPVLLEIGRRVDEDGGFLAAVTTPAALDARHGQLAGELEHAHTGLVLCPTAGTHRLDVTVPGMGPARPGRGVLVSPRGVERVQVARPP